MSDLSRAMALLSALTDKPDEMRVVVLDGVPASKSRPRFGRGGRVYTTAESRAAERATAWGLRQAIPVPMTGNVALVCIFFRPNKQRIDADNMLKHVCDAANGVVWVDDSQVTSIAGVVEFDAVRPRTVVAIAPHATSMTRGADDTTPCAACGAPMPMAGKGYKTKFCSAACRARPRAVAAIGPKECPQCKREFKPANTRQKLCSQACRAESLRATKRAAAKPRSCCSTCGKQLAHTRGGQCRGCWSAGIDRERPRLDVTVEAA